MPNIIQGAGVGVNNASNFNESYDYSYPNGLDLDPTSDFHTRLKDLVLRKARASSNIMSTRHKAWKDIDHTLTAYIPTSIGEQKVKKEDSRKPISIVFPYSYTILETLLAFYSGIFLVDPIFRYEGVAPSDVIGAALLEKVIALQCSKTKVGLNLHTQARDAFSYGFGVVTPTWTTRYGEARVTEPDIFGDMRTSTRSNTLLFEGNSLENVDPYLYLPDPTVPIHEPQLGEFVAWGCRSNYPNLLTEERNNPDVFNVRYLKEVAGRRSSVFTYDRSGRGTKSGISIDSTSTNYYDVDTKVIDIIKMYLKIIPNDWGLGSSEYPEIWYFELASDCVLIQCRPANLSHNKFPVSVIAPDFDGYSLSPIGRVEMLYGMQGVLDFLFNSHIKNVRKSINDMIIYDPYLVNAEDLKNPEPGKLIRLRRPAWGRGVQNVASQLVVQDITQANVANANGVISYMERISGVDSAMQGAIRKGGPERLTSTEFKGSMAGGLTRLERMAKIIAMQGMQDIGHFFAEHNRQMMQNPAYVKITGEWSKLLQKELGEKVVQDRYKVSPEELDINYDVIVKDGSMPGGDVANWLQIFQIMSSNPELAQNFDVTRVFKHIARMSGAKNVDDFVKSNAQVTPQTMPNDQVQQQVQAGNLMPVGGM